jgi:hypothetical protein
MMKTFLLAALVNAVLFLPWLYRRCRHFDAFVLIVANNGANLWMGSSPESDHSDMLCEKQLSIFHPLGAVPGLFALIPIFTAGQDRYHLPMNSFIGIFSASVIAMLLNKMRGLGEQMEAADV